MVDEDVMHCVLMHVRVFLVSSGARLSEDSGGFYRKSSASAFETSCASGVVYCILLLSFAVTLISIRLFIIRHNSFVFLFLLISDVAF